MSTNKSNDLVRVLIGYEPGGDLRMRFARNHRFASRTFIAAPHAVDFERRPRPLALERGVVRFTEGLRGAHLSEISSIIEGKGGNRSAFSRRQLAHPIIKAVNGNTPVR